MHSTMLRKYCRQNTLLINSRFNLLAPTANNLKNIKRKFSISVKDIEFAVTVVFPDGHFQPEIVDMKALKGVIPEIHARDIVSLGLSMEERNRVHVKHIRRTPNMLIARDNVIISSFGNIKIILESMRLIVFEPKLPAVKSWIEHLSRELTNKDKGKCFELFVLEDLLRVLCDSYDRRVSLYSSLLSNIINDEDSYKENFDESVLHFSLFSNLFAEEKKTMNRNSENQIYKLSPFSDVLYEFELELKDTEKSIVEVLKNNKDLEKLNITALRDAKLKGIPYDSDENDEAELLLESYALRLTSSLTDVLQLQQAILLIFYI